MDNGGIREVVPNPELIADKYFDRDLGEEDDEFGREEEEMVWGDGTNVEMANGNVGLLYSCWAETYGSVIVDLKLKEIDMPQLGEEQSIEEEELSEGRPKTTLC